MRFSGDTLKRLRLERRWDQHRLAEAARSHGVGITQSQISRYENDHEPSGRNALALASALGVRVEDLYDRAGDDDEEEDSSAMPLSRDEFAMLGDLMGRLGATIHIGAETRS